MSTETNWYVITGGPDSGLTSTGYRLAFLGYCVVPEAARVLIDNEISKGKSLAEIRADEAEFQKHVFQMKLDAERRFSLGELRFFERGIPCSIAYYRVAGIDPAEVVDVSKDYIYKGVFLLEQLKGFEKDYARTENEQLAHRINQLLYEAYSDLGYNIIRVPLMPIDERVRFILSRL